MLYPILHNIRSAYNVGAIFRTADACGISKIYVTGYTAGPVDRFGRPDAMIAKTALGAEKTIAWERAEIVPLIEKLKGEGVQMVALEQSPRSVDYKQYDATAPTALILGNEVGGVEKELLELCDAIIEIPMRGAKESLNVSVAAGIVLARLTNL